MAWQVFSLPTKAEVHRGSGFFFFGTTDQLALCLDIVRSRVGGVLPSAVGLARGGGLAVVAVPVLAATN